MAARQPDAMTEQQPPRLCGCLRILHSQPDALSNTPLFRGNVARIGRNGLTFDLRVLARRI